MIKEALQYLIGLSELKVINQDGFSYHDKDLKIFRDPVIDEFTTFTLAGLIEYCDTIVRGDNQIIIHIAGYNQVNCYSMNVDKWQRRILYAKAAPIQGCTYQFGYQLDIEKFIIALRANFVPSETIDNIISTVGNITDNEIKDFADDGITQTATVRSGINLKAKIELPPVIRLAPYRTFIEIEQPKSDFIFRVKKGDNAPTCAIHECNDNRWKFEAIDRIETWFDEYLSHNKNRDYYTIIA